MKAIKRLLCKVFGHMYKFNFNVLPNEYKCRTCGAKEEFNIRTLRWEKV